MPVVTRTLPSSSSTAQSVKHTMGGGRLPMTSLLGSRNSVLRNSCSSDNGMASLLCQHRTDVPLAVPVHEHARRLETSTLGYSLGHLL